MKACSPVFPCVLALAALLPLRALAQPAPSAAQPTSSQASPTPGAEPAPAATQPPPAPSVPTPPPAPPAPPAPRRGPRLSFTSQLIFPVMLNAASWGEVGTPGAISLAHGLNLGIPLGGPYALGIELGFNTPMTVFNPYPQIVIAPSYRISDSFSLAFCAMYRFAPFYPKTSMALPTPPREGQIFAFGLAPAFNVTGGITVSFPVVFLYAVRDGTPDQAMLVFSVKLGLPLATL